MQEELKGYPPRRDPAPLLEYAVAASPMAVFQHPERSCVYAEVEACVEQGKITHQAGAQFIALLSRVGFPRDSGLSANGVIVRDQRDERVRELCRAWWDATEAGPVRDQLHLQVAVWQSAFNLAVIHPSEFGFEAFFRLMPHKRQRDHATKLFSATLARTYATPVGYALEAAEGSYHWMKRLLSGHPAR